MTDQIDSIYDYMLTGGLKRQTEFITDAKANKRVASTGPGQRAIKEASRLLLPAIKNYAETGRKAGTKKRVVQLISAVSAEACAAVAVNVLLNNCAYGNTEERGQGLLAELIGQRLSEEADMRLVEKHHGEAYKWNQKKLVAGCATTRRLAVKRLTALLDDSADRWDTNDRKVLGSLLIQLALDSCGLFERHQESERAISAPGGASAGRGRKGSVRTVIRLTPQFADWLADSLDASALMRPLHMPVPHVPIAWDRDGLGGYLPERRAQLPFISRRGDKAVERALEAPGAQRVMDAVTVVQSTGWTINERTLAVYRHAVENNWLDPEFVKLSPGDKPTAPEHPWAERDPEWTAYKLENAAWRAAMDEHKVSVRSTARVITCAKRLEEMGTFYYPHFVDFRGRTYPIAAPITPQGDDVAKGLLQFAEGQPLGDKGLLWLSVHGANCWGQGVDKDAINGRLRWVEANRDKIRAVAADPLANRWWAEADEPLQFLAFCYDMAGALEAPVTAEYVSHLPCCMDASTNALQIMSLVTRDEEGARNTNCLDVEKPNDLYTRVAERTTARLHATLGDPGADEKHKAWAQGFLNAFKLMGNGTMPRAWAKKPCMTLGYGSTDHSAQGVLSKAYLDWITKTDLPASQHPFPDKRPFQALHWLTGRLMEAVRETVGGVTGILEWTRAAADIISDTGRQVTWTTPTGFRVSQGYWQRKEFTTNLRLSGKQRLSIPHHEDDTSQVHKDRARRGFSPNWVHSLDACALHLALLACHDNGLTSLMCVHDSFGTHAANVGTMVDVLRETYVLMFTEDLLGGLKAELEAQLDVELPPLPEYGDLDIDAVRGARYLFS